MIVYRPQVWRETRVSRVTFKRALTATENGCASLPSWLLLSSLSQLLALLTARSTPDALTPLLSSLLSRTVTDFPQVRSERSF